MRFKRWHKLTEQQHKQIAEQYPIRVLNGFA